MGGSMSSNSRFASDQDGSVLVETTVLLPILLIFFLGAIDFLFAFYQWSIATKAVEVGARIAAVSDPVASGLKGLSTAVIGGAVGAGDPMPSFQVTCDGAAKSCTCTSTAGSCPGMGTFSMAAMNQIVCGRQHKGAAECDYSTMCKNQTIYFVGMCDIFGKITVANVKVVYTQTGLGFAGRAGGPVPTVTVSLQNLTFPFLFFQPFNFVSATTTTTGEVLSSAAQ
jgi:hypothetical protein